MLIMPIAQLTINFLLGNVHIYIPNIMNYPIFYPLICHMISTW